jgi:hypothetical protein
VFVRTRDRAGFDFCERPAHAHAGNLRRADILARENPGQNPVEAAACLGCGSSVRTRPTLKFWVSAQGALRRDSATARRGDGFCGGAAYVAFAGSRKKVAFLTKKLEDTGVPPEQLAALHAPTGLDLGR